jgi:glyoxylase-like metal-dependent hydrolase (beta-lactamase superfamily II)
MSQQIRVESIKNFPVASNCYLIIKEGYEGCILIDPACEEGLSLDKYLIENNIKPDYIILTHEHFDHISSVEFLRRKYNCKVLCSAICSENITSSKKNLSVFYNQVGFSCSPADLTIEELEFELLWQNIQIRFYQTPGHSEGGICFGFQEYLFTGDTILQNHSTVVKLPGGNKIKLAQTLKMLRGLIRNDTRVFPGHGDSFAVLQFDNPF